MKPRGQIHWEDKEKGYLEILAVVYRTTTHSLVCISPFNCWDLLAQSDYKWSNFHMKNYIAGLREIGL